MAPQTEEHHTDATGQAPTASTESDRSGLPALRAAGDAIAILRLRGASGFGRLPPLSRPGSGLGSTCSLGSSGPLPYWSKP